MSPALEDEEFPMVLNIEGDGELLKEYVSESRDHLNNIEEGALVLEEHPNDAETLSSVFRSFHTFKGGAGFLNLVPINKLAHGLESLLDLARQQKLLLDGERIELILCGRDTLKQFIDQIDAQLSGTAPRAPILIPISAFGRQLEAALICQPKAESPGEAPEQTAVAAPSASPTVKVETSKLDSLVDLVGELVIAQSLVAQDFNHQAFASPRFARNKAQMARVTRELQRVSLSLRMVPIRGVFQKMARLVHNLSVRQNKEIQLVTEGGETELDRNLVEELADPLLHMIRNAVDHGIEPAEVRLAKGKPRTGVIHLRARHEAGGIVVELQDDGQGLDKERIMAKAVEKGLAAPDAKLSDEDIFRFIFAAGFSTAEEVTELSGRGVGLDVLRRNIERLRGRVDVTSVPGQGTLFKLALPLTLAIIDGLIVTVAGERYIIPTLLVRESFRPRPEMISALQGRGELVNLRGRLIPMLRLGEHFGLKPSATDPTEGIIVVVQTGASLKCLLVDGLLHRQEIVIKTVGEMIRQRNSSIAGAAILGDGQVGLIIDVNALGSLPQMEFAAANN
jgi:two-component system chemotaxis sensor kinase CheA